MNCHEQRHKWKTGLFFPILLDSSDQTMVLRITLNCYGMHQLAIPYNNHMRLITHTHAMPLMLELAEEALKNIKKGRGEREVGAAVPLIDSDQKGATPPSTLHWDCLLPSLCSLASTPVCRRLHYHRRRVVMGVLLF